jgi:ActR/RegA family two-component response regulator
VASGADAVGKTISEKPDFIVMDLSLTGDLGLQISVTAANPL